MRSDGEKITIIVSSSKPLSAEVSQAIVHMAELAAAQLQFCSSIAQAFDQTLEQSVMPPLETPEGGPKAKRYGPIETKAERRARERRELKWGKKR